MKTKHLLYLSLLSYLIPCLIFGELKMSNIILLVITTPILAYLINYKAEDGKDWPTYVYSFIHGASLAHLGISILGLTTNGTVLKMSISFGSLIFIFSAILFISSSSAYRTRKRSKYLKLFENDSISLERDEKLKKILGNRF
jgi:hypothetical protein